MTQPGNFYLRSYEIVMPLSGESLQDIPCPAAYLDDAWPRGGFKIPPECSQDDPVPGPKPEMSFFKSTKAVKGFDWIILASQRKRRGITPDTVHDDYFIHRRAPEFPRIVRMQ